LVPCCAVEGWGEESATDGDDSDGRCGAFGIGVTDGRCLLAKDLEKRMSGHDFCDVDSF
jgi:hypothetical protein